MTLRPRREPLLVRTRARFSCVGDGLCCSDIHACALVKHRQLTRHGPLFLLGESTKWRTLSGAFPMRRLSLAPQKHWVSICAGAVAVAHGATVHINKDSVRIANPARNLGRIALRRITPGS